MKSETRRGRPALPPEMRKVSQNVTIAAGLRERWRALDALARQRVSAAVSDAMEAAVSAEERKARRKASG